jgi:hypothetical protein
MSLDDKYITREVLPGGNVVNEEGDIIPDPQSSLFPDESQETTDVPSEDDPIITDESALEGAEEKNLKRVLGVLSLVGFGTTEQQTGALRRPEFSEVLPDASDEVIYEAAKLVLTNQKAEDMAVRDPRTGS